MLGKIKMNIFIWIFMVIMFLAPCYTYYMATYWQHSQKPFPAATITSTACHYPQDILFRFAMLIGISFLVIIFYSMFRWVQNVTIKAHFPHRLQKWQFYLAELSILLYGVTIGTIDEKSTGPLHGPCAVIFFIIWFYTVVHITIFLTDLRKWDTSIISKQSLRLKQALAIYLIAVWVYCAFYLILYSDQVEGKGDKYVVILQWNSVFTNILWMITFVHQWKYFDLCLNKK